MRVRVDPILCTGHGICAGISSRVFKLDDWNCAYVAPEFACADIPEELEIETSEAANRCPEGAIVTVAQHDQWFRIPSWSHGR